ncbi:hypothetical protein AX16_001849 [Volvariella volvacea WC 439]|nr:hypothetical protein AX16_001849 [Volvariella volvacea WC 439]
MHSSTYQGNVGPGGSDSQNISPGVTESQGGYVGYTEGPAPTVHSERASPSNPSLALAPSNISWPYIQAGSLKDESLGFENHGHPASTSSMIGPTSTFYDSSSSSQRLLDNDLQQYQQWWDAFGSQGLYHVVVQETYGQGATHHNNQGSIQYNPVANQYGTQHTSAPYAEAISSMPTTSMIGAINLPPSTFAPRAAHQPPPQHRQTQAHSYIPPATSQTTQTANPITSYQQNPQQSKQAQHNVPLQPQTQGQARPVIHQPQPQPPQQTKPAVAQEKSTEKPQQVIQQPRQPAPVNPSRGAKKRDRSSRTGRSASGSKANGSVTKSRSQDVAIVARQVRFKASPQEPQVNPSAAQAPTTSVSRVTKKRKRETNHSASGGEMFQISQSSSEEEGEGEDDVPYPTGNGGITVGVGGLGVERPGKANPQRL